MSYRLTKLIQSLNKEEVRNFKIYTSRFSQKSGEKKMIMLFDAIRKGSKDEYDEQLVYKLFSTKSKNSYYRLKNRLIREIEDSLTQLHRHKDEEFQLYQFLQLSKMATFKSEFEEAREYLRKAETLAIELEKYIFLNIIYERLLELAHRTELPELPEIIEKYRNNNNLTQLTRESNLLRADIIQKLRRSNFSGKESEVIDTLNEHIERLQAKNKSLHSTKVRFQINKSIRNVLLQKKDFESLLNYSIDSYEEFIQGEVFDKSNHEEKILMLVWIINAITKTSKLSRAEHYIEALSKALEEYNKLFYNKYIWLYYQSKVIYYTFSQQCKAAIELLEKVKEEKLVKDNTNHLIFTYVNLSTLYYFEYNLDEALSNLAVVILSPTFRGLSEEWKMRILFLEIMLRYDNGDIDYTINRCKELKRKHRELLKGEAYQRENEFLHILTQLLRKPKSLDAAGFEQEIQDFIAQSPVFEPGSNEFLNYALWLKTKIQHKHYYNLLPNIF